MEKEYAVSPKAAPILIEDAIKHHQEVIDCGININRFVYEIQKLQKEFGTKDNVEG